MKDARFCHESRNSLTFYTILFTSKPITAFWQKIQNYLRAHAAPSVEEQKKYHYDFAVTTSFHGVHKLVNSDNHSMRSKIRKVAWMSVVTVCSIMAFWQVCLRLMKFYTWPTTTSVTVQYVENIEFPSVTFCSLNRFQTKAVNNLSIAFFMWNVVSAVLLSTSINEDVYALQEVIEFLQNNQNFSIKEFTKNNGFYLNNSTLLKCTYFGIPCYAEDFHHVFTEYGNCYTFNHNHSSLSKKASSSGSGLSVLFDIKQLEFTDDPSLGFVDAGITFVVHSSNLQPKFDGHGLYSPVGMHGHTSIRNVKTIIQEYPWGECNPDLRLEYHGVYNTYGCLQECKSRYIQDECRCYPFLLPGRGKQCDIQQLYNCVSAALYKIEKFDLCTVGTYNSTCPVPCEETDYPATISYSTFPSDRAAEYLSLKLGRNTTYMRNNLVYIDIKYQELNYKITRQQKALTSTVLLSDIGGQLGLFCGASLITIIEIFEYIVINLYWIFVFIVLKAPNMSFCSTIQSRYRRDVEEC